MTRAIPPMPPMVPVGDGFWMSAEALGSYARAGVEWAVKALADAGVEWDRVHWTQQGENHA